MKIEQLNNIRKKNLIIYPSLKLHSNSYILIGVK